MKTPFQLNLQETVSLFESLAELETGVQEAARIIATALNAGCQLLACGNGGSASAAAHMTTEFVCRFNNDRRPYPAVCLNTHGGDLTAIGNDYDFQNIFSRQVEAFARPGDALIVFSTSGNSENVCRALKTAKQNGIVTIALLGRDGGRCAGQATVELLVKSAVTSRIQETHQFLLHTICELVEVQLTEKI